ncbi:MAG: hypothetical protein ACPG4T_12850 [Nannocystaceae bacterium]
MRCQGSGIGFACLLLAYGCDRPKHDGPQYSNAPAVQPTSQTQPVAQPAQVPVAQPAQPAQPAAQPVASPTQPVAQPSSPVAQPTTAPPVALAGKISELVAGANRKMMHNDGKGCLADLDKLTALDPLLGKNLLIQRAQCEMLVGHCQAGKKIIADYYQREMNMSPKRAELTAESLGSMRCRGGDMTDRDRLLGALFELSDGAYVNPRPAQECLDRIALVRQLAPKVKPRDAMDTQVTAGPQALFHTGATCLAQTGNCRGAYRVYQENYPREALQSITDPATRRKVLEDGFRSSIVLCKQAQLPAPLSAPAKK